MSLFIGMGAIATDRASERRAWWVLRPPIAPAKRGGVIRTHDDVAAIAVFKTAALATMRALQRSASPRHTERRTQAYAAGAPCCVGSEAETKEC